MGVLSYIKTLIGGAGTGVADLAYTQQQNITPASIYGPRYNVRASFNPMSSGFVKMGQEIVPVSMLGDSGLGLAGNIELTPLASEKGT